MTTEAPAGLYPELEPYDQGFLEVDGQRIFYEQCGNPDGKPAVFLHGGPGSGCTPASRRFFDPELYRIVLFDQRGCGRSLPHASTPNAVLGANTTWHLVDDIERLRQHLGIEAWLIFGGSWGSTLALAYAQTHPQRVTELVLRGIFTLRRWELDWFYNGPAGALQPEWWRTFCGPLGDVRDPLDASVDNIARYHELLFDPDPLVHRPAGMAWTLWEAATVTMVPNPENLAGYTPDTALAFARIENHFFVNAGWLDEGQLIAGVESIRHIPCVIVQGRYDLCTPIRTAYDLASAWPEADLRVVQAGHSAFEPAIAAGLVRATHDFASR